MKLAPWLIATATFGILAHLLLKQTASSVSGLHDSVEEAATDLMSTRTKERAKGTVRRGAGRVKKVVGDVTGDEQTSIEGVAEQISAALESSVGKTAQVVSHAIHEAHN